MPPFPNECREAHRDDDAVSRLSDTLKRHRMAAPGDRLLVAVSGGPDSVALIHLLNRIAPRWKFSLAMAHVNHMLRQDAVAAARFVADLADSLGIECHQLTRDVAAFACQRGMSVETAGRAVRYAFFSDLCIRHDYQRVAVGHHRDDCAEQVLMNLARGAGPAGLTGIAPVREDWVIRPLIAFSRDDIIAYLSHAGHPFTKDPTNTDRRMTRNRIRLDVLPVLAEHINPRVAEALARTADILVAENDWMDEMAADRLSAATLERSNEECVLSVAAMSDCPLPLRRRMLRLALRRLKGDLQRISHAHIDAVVALMRRKDAAGTVHLPARILVKRRYDRLTLRHCRSPLRQARTGSGLDDTGKAYLIHIEAPVPGALAVGRFRIEAIGAVCTLREIERPAINPGHSAGHCIAFFDMEKLEFPLILRNVTNGDRFQPLGMTGTQKIYKLLKDNKMALGTRALTPVLVSGDEIVWVPGLKMGQIAAVSEGTRRVIRADFVLPRPKK